MRGTMIVAVILIGLSIMVLAYSGITYKTRGAPVDIGPLHVETTKSHFIPPVVGAVGLIAGIMLLALDIRKAR
jgi:ABC-type nickel/cobalt efflux system permease component RcnA